MEQYVLYLVLKEIAKQLDSNFNYSFSDMDSNADNVCGIYIKGAEPSEYRTLSDGEYYNIINRVQFLIQGGLDNDSLMNSLRLGSNIKDTLIRASNRYITAPSKIGKDGDGKIVITTDGNEETVTDTDGNEETVTDGDEETLESITVMLTKVDLLSGLVNIGKSEQGRPRYSINFRINYELGGN